MPGRCLLVKHCRQHLDSDLWANGKVNNHIADCTECKWDCQHCQNFVMTEPGTFDRLLQSKQCTYCRSRKQSKDFCQKLPGQLTCLACTSRRVSGRPGKGKGKDNDKVTDPVICDWYTPPPSHGPVSLSVTDRQAQPPAYTLLPEVFSAPQNLSGTSSAQFVPGSAPPEDFPGLSDPSRLLHGDFQNPSLLRAESRHSRPELGSFCLQVQCCLAHQHQSLWRDAMLNESVVSCQDCQWPCDFCRQYLQTQRLRERFTNALALPCSRCSFLGILWCVKKPADLGCERCSTDQATCGWTDDVRLHHLPIRTQAQQGAVVYDKAPGDDGYMFQAVNSMDYSDHSRGAANLAGNASDADSTGLDETRSRDSSHSRKRPRSSDDNAYQSPNEKEWGYWPIGDDASQFRTQSHHKVPPDSSSVPANPYNWFDWRSPDEHRPLTSNQSQDSFQGRSPADDSDFMTRGSFLASEDGSARSGNEQPFNVGIPTQRSATGTMLAQHEAASGATGEPSQYETAFDRGMLSVSDLVKAIGEALSTTYPEERYERGSPIIVTRTEEEWGGCDFEELDSHDVPDSLRDKYGQATKLFYAPATFFRIKHCPRLPNQHLDPGCLDLDSSTTEIRYQESKTVYPSTQRGNWKHRSSGWYMSPPHQTILDPEAVKRANYYSDEERYYKPSHYILEAAFPSDTDITHGPWRAMYKLRQRGGSSVLPLEKWTSDELPEGAENSFVCNVLKRHSVVTARRVRSVDAGLTMRGVPRGAEMPSWMKNQMNPFAMPNLGTDSLRLDPALYPDDCEALRLLWGKTSAAKDDYVARWSRTRASHLQSDAVLRFLWRHYAIRDDFHERHTAIQLGSVVPEGDSYTYSMSAIRERGWHMVRAPGKAIKIDVDHADVFFLMEKFHPKWHGGFRFGGIGLLNVGETPKGVWHVRGVN